MTFRLVVCLLLTGVVGTAQPPPAPSSDQPPTARFGAATSGVVVDVVVRDSRGRPVLGLSRDDFEIYEDGVPQNLVAFEPYEPTDAPPSVADAMAAAGVKTNVRTTTKRLAEGPPVIALAWDRLGPESRALAHRAAKRLVETKAPGELVGVFLTDMTLYTLQPYTTDSAKLVAAVEDLATRATSALDREPSPLDRMVGRAQTPPTASAADGGYGLAGFDHSPSDGRADGERPDRYEMAGGWPGIVAMLQRMERTYTQFLYEAQGRASMLGLLALVDSLGQLPGRKTLFYFCEGLTIPDSQQARFRAVIDTANRNNVSVYTFDSAGLRVHSAQQQTAREIRELSFTGLGAASTRSPKWNESLEDNERLLKMDPAVSLGILADQTGGLLVNNTNALDRAIDRINDDRRKHYLLSYVSTNTSLDGAYRRIEVKVKRRNVDVRARRGYRAVAASATAPVLAYEAPALKALDAAPSMRFPMVTRALSTPLPGRPGLTSIVVNFNGLSLATAKDKEGTGYLAEATVVARVVDRAKAEVARLSQQYQFTGELAKRDASLGRDILFFRSPELPPGTFTLEAVVYDGIAEAGTVLRTPVEVPQVDAAVQVGDLIVVSRVEPFTAGPEVAARHPLVSKGVLFYPSLGEPVAKATQTELTLALPMVVQGAAPATELEILRNRQRLARLPLPADAPEAGGRLMLVGRLPLAPLPPGVYDLRVNVTTPGGVIVRQASVTVVP
jgi:VWFA-related protein